MTTPSNPDNQPVDGSSSTHPNNVTPNGDIGEIAIDLGDDRFILRPTFGCLQRIQTGTGKDVAMLHHRLIHERSIGVDDLLTVIANGIRAGGVAVPKDLGDRIFNEGMIEITARAIEFLTNAQVGPKNLKALSAKNANTSPAGGAGEK